MTDLYNLSYLATLPAFFLCGLFVGNLYFSALRATANAIVTGGHPLLGLALTIVRFVILGIGLYAAVLSGSLSLLAELAGILCMRVLMFRQKSYQNRDLR